MHSQSEFDGTVAVVTGAAQGIGQAIAKSLLEVNAKVVGLDVQFTQTSIIPTDTFQQLHLNVRCPKAVASMVDNIERQLGPIDYLVSAAGILHINSLLETTERQWQETFEVNTQGAFNVCRAVGRYMSTRKSGSIVAVSSNASHTPRLEMGAYCASKAALTQMIKCLGLELATHNIRCNLVSPGSTDTPMQRQLWRTNCAEDRVIEGSLDQYRLGIPLERIASPKAIAQSVRFLLSHSASHITMHNIVVDGGATLGH